MFRQEVLTSVGLILGTSPVWQSWGTYPNETDAVAACRSMYGHSQNKCRRRVVECDAAGKVVREVFSVG